MFKINGYNLFLVVEIKDQAKQLIFIKDGFILLLFEPPSNIHR